MNKLLEIQQLEFAHPGQLSKKSFRISMESFHLFPGEIHTVMGPNGSGKSTLLRLAAGLLQPDRGQILLNEKDLSEFSPRERAQNLGFLPQKLDSSGSTSALEIVLMGRFPWNQGLGLPDEKDLCTAEEAMDRMKVLHLKNQSVQNLSGGEFQRVWIASVLAQNAKVILLDEPTHWLDIHHQIQCFELLREESRRNAGILITTHDLNLASHFSNRITLVKDGKIMASGLPDKIFEEELLQETYGHSIRIVPLPDSQSKAVVPQTRNTSNSEPSTVVSDPSEKASPSSAKSISEGLTSGKLIKILTLFFLASVFTVFLTPWFGSEKIDPQLVVHEFFGGATSETWSSSTQIFNLRLPRTGMAFLAGMALACTGAAFQSLLRNPLAEPYTLGTASAAALGAVTALSFPSFAFQWGPLSGVQVLAFAFSLAGTALLWILSRKLIRGDGLTSLLLLGITLGLVASAGTLLVRFLANPLVIHAMDQWMIGGVDVTRWKDVYPVLPFLIPGVVLVLSCMTELNHLELGEEIAFGRGVEVQSVRRFILLGGSLMTASVVSVVGPIGFIGLMVPYYIRKLIGTDLRLVLPCSLFGGGIVLVLADAVARSISLGGRGAELPVGIITSIGGGILFLFILVRNRQGPLK